MGGNTSPNSRTIPNLISSVLSHIGSAVLKGFLKCSTRCCGIGRWVVRRRAYLVGRWKRATRRTCPLAEVQERKYNQKDYLVESAKKKSGHTSMNTTAVHTLVHTQNAEPVCTNKMQERFENKKMANRCISHERLNREGTSTANSQLW